jgi:hypothetical protein
MHIRIAILYPVLALAACGRSTPPPAPAEAAQLRALATTVVSVIESYGARAAAMASSAACRADRAGYEARVGPAIESIGALAARLDPWLQARGPSEYADLACAASAMLAELERHTDIACTSPDLPANRAETAAHVLVMERWADLALARLGEVSAPGGREGAGSGPRCVRFSDGGRMYLP